MVPYSAPGITNKPVSGIRDSDFFFMSMFFSTQSSKFPVSIKAPVGELLQGCPMTEADFLAKQGLPISYIIMLISTRKNMASYFKFLYLTRDRTNFNNHWKKYLKIQI